MEGARALLPSRKYGQPIDTKAIRANLSLSSLIMQDSAELSHFLGLDPSINHRLEEEKEAAKLRAEALTMQTEALRARNEAARQQREQRQAKVASVRRRGGRIGALVGVGLIIVLIIAAIGGAFSGDDDTAAPSDPDAPTTTVTTSTECPPEEGTEFPERDFDAWCDGREDRHATRSELHAVVGDPLRIHIRTGFQVVDRTSEFLTPLDDDLGRLPVAAANAFV